MIWIGVAINSMGVLGGDVGVGLGMDPGVTGETAWLLNAGLRLVNAGMGLING